MNVKQKQWQLFYLGYYGSSVTDIDGIWGNKSIKATKKFQKASNLKEDGIFGTNSINKSKAVIKAIQKALGGLLQDGLAGQLTVNMTSIYQGNNGLTKTGRADEATRNKLGINMKTISATTSSSSSTTINTTINTTIGSTTSSTTTNSSATDFWSTIKHFSKNEFKCKCGGKYCNGFYNDISQTLVKCCVQVREYFDAPFNITSGLRCPTHNANEGGVSNSRHIYGKAVDFYITGKTADEVLAYVKTLPNIRYCYKINSRCVHMDVVA